MGDPADARRIFQIVMLFALLVTGARLAAPFEIGKDQSLQLEAAQRLVDGKGLTSTYWVHYDSRDLAAPPIPEPLTWWPPGFSLLIAGLRMTGLPLLLVLKSVYGLTTIAGWIGWGRIAQRALTGERAPREGEASPIEPSSLSASALFPASLFAALLPIFHTPWWGGTDLFLWAGIPFIFLLLFRTGARAQARALAGLLLGALYAMRWASMFVTLASALVIVFQLGQPGLRGIDRRATARRLLQFSVPLGLVALPIFLYIRAQRQGGLGLPDYVRLGGEGRSLPALLDYVFRSLPVASDLALGHPLLEDLVMHKIGSRPLSYAVGIASLAALAALPPLLLRSAGTPRSDLLAGLAWLPICLMAMLIVMGLIAPEQQQLEHRRFHMPVRTVALFAAWQLALVRPVRPSVRAAAGGALLLFLAYYCLYQPLRLFSPEKRYSTIQTVLGFTPPTVKNYSSTSQPIGYPDNRLYSLKESSRLRIKALHDASPDALFFIDNYSYFVYDNFAGTGLTPGGNVRRLPDPDFREEAYVSRPMKIYWVMDRLTPSAQWLPMDQLTLVFSDPSEKTYIFASALPAGFRFSTMPRTLKQLAP
ncbi:MAG: hypothetical protein SF339_12455 [Blastocatellia bacterium]|nr:hypothetical protein [Blastocatellia bacterium]